MKRKYFFRAIVFSITILSFFSCKKTTNNAAPQQAAAELTVSAVSENFTDAGGSQDITITSNADWTLYNPASTWLQTSATSGKSGSTIVHLTTISPNATGLTYSGILEISSSNGKTLKLIVTQLSTTYPSYNTSPIAPDASGMGSTATQLATKISMGWNIYNTMEAPGGETGWGNPVINQGLIDLVKSTGMNAIRIPIEYDESHLINRGSAQIDPAWLARIHQVIQYCFNDNMYVIINIHSDDGWLDCTVTGAKQDSINAKQKAFWEQIATEMRDFDEHLMFASANEPNANNVATTVTLMRYHQTFINAVRSTGGRNTYRTLIIQAPSTSVDLANSYLNPSNPSVPLPTDPTPNKMMLEFHYYNPPQFCILGGPGTTPSDASWGKELYFWGQNFHTTNPLFLNRNCAASTEESYVASIMNTVKVNFGNKGIPLFMGEFDNQYHAGKLTGYPADSILAIRSGDHYYATIVKQAKANGVLPFLWASGIFNRSNNTIGNHASLDSVKSAGGF